MSRTTAALVSAIFIVASGVPAAFVRAPVLPDHRTLHARPAALRMKRLAVVSRLAERHRTSSTSRLRAAVLGANEGVLSTSSLVLGVAAAHGSHGGILAASRSQNKN